MCHWKVGRACSESRNTFDSTYHTHSLLNTLEDKTECFCTELRSLRKEQSAVETRSRPLNSHLREDEMRSDEMQTKCPRPRPTPGRHHGLEICGG